MTKEELKKEAEERADEYTNLRPFHIGYEEGYFDGAEPREKRIAELEKENKALGERCLQLQKDKGELIDKVRELEKENAELRKEWHYMKDVNCYEDLPQNKDVYYAYVVNVGAYDKPTIERKLGCFAEFEFDVMAYHVIAWKEIVLPKETE